MIIDGITDKEALARIQREFPGRYVSFNTKLHSHAGGATRVEIQMYDEALGFIPCNSLHDGIAKLHKATDQKGEASAD